MIAKTPEKRSDGNSSFSTLKKYISTREIRNELTGEIDLHEIATDTNCISLHTASAEMKAVADMNGRVKDPVYHTVVSWPSFENPTDAQMFEAGRAAIKAVGMEGHQYVIAIHRDTDKPHVHIMVNRVHPQTERTVYPDRDFYKLDKCMREVELKQGWSHADGPYSVQERNGIKVIDWSSKTKDTKGKLSTKARDFEAKTGNESLHSYARRTARNDVFKLLKNPNTGWQDVHAHLAVFGLEIKEKGLGFGIYSKSDAPSMKLEKRPSVKASDVHEMLGKGRLEKQLGPFEPVRKNIEAFKPAPENAYSAHREKPTRTRTPDQQARRDAQREARAQARADLKTRYDAYKSEQLLVMKPASVKISPHQALLMRVTARANLERKRITNSGLPTTEKAALRSVVAFNAAQERERIKGDLAIEHKARKPANFKDWTAQQATTGDAAAIAQMNGWAYTDKRKTAELKRAVQEATALASIAAKDSNDEPPMPPLKPLEGISWAMDKRLGTVVYRRGGIDIFTDIGQRIGLSDAAAGDRGAIAAALMVARQKFGSELTLTGSVEFKKLAVQVMVQNGIVATLADPSLEKFRQQLSLEKQHAITTRNQRSHSQQHVAERPPANRRDRLHHLSESDLVLDTQLDVSLLQGHVSDRVAERQKGGNYPMQREEPGAHGAGGKPADVVPVQVLDAIDKALTSGDKAALGDAATGLQKISVEAQRIEIYNRPRSWEQTVKFAYQHVEVAAAQRVNDELRDDVKKFGLAVPGDQGTNRWDIAERAARQALAEHESTTKPLLVGRGEWVARQELLRRRVVEWQQRLAKRDALSAREKEQIPQRLLDLEKQHQMAEEVKAKNHGGAVKQLERIKPLLERVHDRQLELGHIKTRSRGLSR